MSARDADPPPEPPHYTMPLTVRFAHCDPAGIVFFPRLYEMANLAIECFFEDRVGASFHQLHLREGLGVPTVRIETEFRAVSRLEDRIAFDLRIARRGTSSVCFDLTCRAAENAGDLRVRTIHTLVAIDMASTKATAWPTAIRDRLDAIASGSDASGADDAGTRMGALA